MTEEKKINPDTAAENKKVLDALDAVADSKAPSVQAPDEDDDELVPDDSEELVTTGFTAQVKDQSPEQIEKEKGVKKKCDGRILTIESWKITPPKTHEFVNGEKVSIPPKSSNNGKSKKYDVKLALRFTEENLVEYIPGLSVFINNGKLNPNVNIYREGNSQVTQLFRLAVNEMAGGKFKLVKKTINEKSALVVDESCLKEYLAFEKTISRKEGQDRD
jgi:hypothetical protein